MRGVLNCNKYIFPSDPLYNFPLISPNNSSFNFKSIKWFEFEKRNNVSDFNISGLHFYHDDYKFECVWNYPERYIDFFKKFKCIIMPDFSLYYDYPIVLQMYNKYRNHWLYNYFMLNNINIIPNINISSFDNWDWSFIGYPKNSIIAHSCIGISKHDITDLKNLDIIIDKLKPIKILYFNRLKNNVNSDIIIDIKIPYRKD